MFAMTDRFQASLFVSRQSSGRCLQIVEPGAVEYSRMRVLDLSQEVARKGAQPVADALAERELSTPFELYRYPPVRGVLARLGDQDHAIVLVSHHVRTLFCQTCLHRAGVSACAAAILMSPCRVSVWLTETC